MVYIENIKGQYDLFVYHKEALFVSQGLNEDLLFFTSKQSRLN
jgi:hypothetical protein